SYKVLKKGGRLVSVAGIPDPDEARPHGVRTDFVFVSPNGTQLRRIAELIESGAVRPADFEVMRLEEAAKAQELSRAGHVRGKIVLKVR
ncbi:MAG: zinc-binding dehydrogenase, partial [Deltaproteobacteria bacterium]